MDIYYENQHAKSEKRIREYQRLFQEQLSARRQDRTCSADFEQQDENQAGRKSKSGSGICLSMN